MLSELRDQHHQRWTEHNTQNQQQQLQNDNQMNQIAAQHAEEIRLLQTSNNESAQQLDDLRQKLLDASHEKEKATSKISDLEQKCASLQAQLCITARTATADDDDDDDDNGNQQQDGATTKKSNHYHHPQEESAVSLLRAQNEQLLQQISQLSNELSKHTTRSQNDDANQHAGDISSSSLLIQRFEDLSSHLVSANDDDHHQLAAEEGRRSGSDSSSSDQQQRRSKDDIIASLRRDKIVLEERVIIAERRRARVEQLLAASPVVAATTVDENGSSSARRRIRGDEGRDGGKDGHVSAPQSPETQQQQQQEQQQDDDNNQQQSQQQPQEQQPATLHDYQHARDTIPKSTTELIRFWSYGQGQINTLKLELTRAQRLADEASLRADAADALARSRSELVSNIQALAVELETSRDESARLHCDIEGLERETALLTSHLTAALAAAVSKEEVERCAADMKEAARKAATIAALSAPEMSVAKDALKKNQALQQELLVMAKRRDDLSDEIAAKTRALEHLSSNIWLRSMNEEEARRAELAALTVGGGFNFSSSGAAAASSSPFPSDQKRNPTKFSDAHHNLPANSTRQQLISMQAEIEIKNATIHDQRRALAEQQQQSGRTENNNNNLAVDSSSLTSSVNDILLHQDTALASIQQRLATANSAIEQHESFSRSTLGIVADMASLVQHQTQLLDSILATHRVFSNSSNNKNTNDDDIHSDQQQQQQQSTSSLTSEELSVIRSILSTLEQHKSLVSDRVAVLETFKTLGDNAQALSNCNALERRIGEVNAARQQVVNLSQRVGALKSEAAEKLQWYTAVDQSVSAFKKEGKSAGRDTEAAFSVLSDLALHRIEVSAKEHAAAAKPAPPSAATSSTNAAPEPRIAMDAAANAMKRGVTFLQNSTTASVAASTAGTAAPTASSSPSGSGSNPFSNL